MVVSLVGTWMQSVAQSWLVYRLTHSEFLLGATWFCTQIPVLILAPVGGIAADRFPRHRIVLATQALSMAQALVLAALTLSGRVQTWHVLVLAAGLGVINAFDIPGRQSLFVELVGKEDLLNAISLNSAIFNLARIAGPSAAGFMVAAFGEGICFAFNGVSFIAAIASFGMMRIPRRANSLAGGFTARFVEGFGYAHRSRPLRILLWMTGAVNLAIAPVIALSPFFADAIFHKGSLGLGVLTGAMGIGAVVGTVSLARRKDVSGLAGVILESAVVMGVSLAVFAWAPSFLLCLAMMLLAGYGIFRQNASANTLIQTMIPDDYRGRIMALYSMMVIGFLPIGSLAAGALAEAAGPRWTVFAGAILCLASAAAYRIFLPEFRNSVCSTNTPSV